MRDASRLVVAAIVAVLFSLSVRGQTSKYFVVRVVDEQTGRGVPLVELKLQNEVKYWTDSAGVAALNEPSMRNRKVFLAIRSHGYEYPDETPFGRCVVVTIEPGKTRELRVHRTMIAERLYRLTGEGIYRDSALAGLPVPAKGPPPKALVLGQDTVCGTLYRGKIFWNWGDTIELAHWNFSVSAATSDPRDDPAVGVHYTYFTEGKAVKIIYHVNYNFYNVATHTFFNQEGGRVIYLEGTYTAAFSGATEKTPCYDYNQVMYRLRLDDPGLGAAQQ